MTSNTGETTLENRFANLDPSTWDPALDAVVAAPANHKVLFENDNLRVLEVNLAPDEEEPVHHHRGAQYSSWTRCKDRSMISRPTGHSRRPIGMSSRLYKHGTVRDAWSLIWRLNPPDVSSTPQANIFTASGLR